MYDKIMESIKKMIASGYSSPYMKSITVETIAKNDADFRKLVVNIKKFCKLTLQQTWPDEPKCGSYKAAKEFIKLVSKLSSKFKTEARFHSTRKIVDNKNTNTSDSKYSCTK